MSHTEIKLAQLEAQLVKANKASIKNLPILVINSMAASVFIGAVVLVVNHIAN